MARASVSVFIRTRCQPRKWTVRWAGVAGNLLVHNAGRAIGVRASHVTASASDGPPDQLVAEPFRGALDAIADAGWTPGRREAVELPGQSDAITPAVRPVPAELVRRLGPGAALVLLQWLVGTLAAPSRLIGRLGADAFGVTATNAEIADLSGLSEAQVRRALGELDRKGMIARPAYAGRRAIAPSEKVWGLLEPPSARDQES